MHRNYSNYGLGDMHRNYGIVLRIATILFVFHYCESYLVCVCVFEIMLPSQLTMVLTCATHRNYPIPLFGLVFEHGI